MGYLDRYGDQVDDDPLEPAHDPRCRDGWLGENQRGQLIPCLTCGPHLRRPEPTR